MKRYVVTAFNDGKLNNIGQNSMEVDATYAMDYNKEDQVTWVSIRTAKTVDLMEVKMFFDNFVKKDYLCHADYSG